MSVFCTSQIESFGHYAPALSIDNEFLENKLDLKPGWIEKRTGIKTRRWVSDDESLIDIAEKAAIVALQHSNIARHDIALTMLATSTPDRLLPPTAPLLTHRLSLSNSGAFDLSGACSGFLYALALADGFVRTQARPVLIVAANILSRRINLSNRNSAVLFGDAAGAALIVPSTDKTKGILGAHFISDGSGYDLISISAGGSERPFSQHIPINEYQINLQDGQAVFTRAVNMMVQCANLAMKKANLHSADIHRFVPHQSNLRITENTAKKLGIPLEKTVSTINEYGNSSAASIPLSLSIAHQANSFIDGEKILLTAAGAGMTGGAIVLGL